LLLYDRLASKKKNILSLILESSIVRHNLERSIIETELLWVLENKEQSQCGRLGKRDSVRMARGGDTYERWWRRGKGFDVDLLGNLHTRELR
jgi:hypothetical protein